MERKNKPKRDLGSFSTTRRARVKLYSFLFSTFQLEEAVSQKMTLLTINIWVILISIGMIEVDQYFPQELALLSGWKEPFLYFIIAFQIVAGLSMGALLLQNSSHFNRGLLGAVAIQIGFVYVMVVNPLLVTHLGMMGRAYLKNSFNISYRYIRLETLIASLGIIVSMFLHGFVRNNLPTQSSTGSPHPLNYLLVFFTVAILHLIQNLASFMVSESRVIYASIFIILGLALCSYRVFTLRMFWSQRTMEVFASGLIKIFIVELVSCLVHIFHPEFYFSFIILIVLYLFNFIDKLVSNILLKLLIKNITNAKISNYSNLFILLGILDVLRFKKRVSNSLLESEEIALKHLEVNLVGKFRDFNNIQKHIELHGEEVCSQFYPHLALMSHIQNNPLNHPKKVLILLKIQMITFGMNLGRILFTLKELERQWGLTHTNSLEVYHLVQIIKARLNTVKNATNEFRELKACCFSEIYNNILSSESKRKSMETSSSSDFNNMLNMQEDYKLLLEDFGLYLDLKDEFFEAIIAKPYLTTRYLYDRQKEMRNKRLEFENKVEAGLSDPNSSLTFLTTAMLYYLKARYDYKKASRIFKKYFNYLSKRYLLLKGGNILTDYTSHTFYTNSVVIRSDLSQSAKGQIMNITSGYSKFLGEIPDGTYARASINDFLPGSLRHIHTDLMHDLKSLNGFYREVEYPTLGFDGFLKSTKIMNRLAVLPSGQPVANSLLLFFETSFQFNVLLDIKLNILGGHKSFYEGIEANFPQGKDQITNIKQVSTVLYQYINFIRFLNNKNEKGDKLADIQHFHYKEQILELIGSKKEKPIAFPINQNTFSFSKDQLISTTLDFFTLGNDQFVKLSGSFMKDNSKPSLGNSGGLNSSSFLGQEYKTGQDQEKKNHSKTGLVFRSEDIPSFQHLSPKVSFQRDTKTKEQGSLSIEEGLIPEKEFIHFGELFDSFPKDIMVLLFADCKERKYPKEVYSSLKRLFKRLGSSSSPQTTKYLNKAGCVSVLKRKIASQAIKNQENNSLNLIRQETDNNSNSLSPRLCSNVQNTSTNWIAQVYTTLFDDEAESEDEKPKLKDTFQILPQGVPSNKQRVSICKLPKRSFFGKPKFSKVGKHKTMLEAEPLKDQLYKPVKDRFQESNIFMANSEERIMQLLDYIRSVSSFDPRKRIWKTTRPWMLI